MNTYNKLKDLVPNLKLCPICNGTGRPPEGWLAALGCPHCKGSGVVEK